MAKLPRPLRITLKQNAMAKKPTPAIQSRIQRAQAVTETSQTPVNPSESFRSVWAARPRLSDLQKLPVEELESAQHQARLNRWRRWPVFGLGFVAFGLGMYGVMLWTSITRATTMKDVPADVSDRFDKNADGYDEKVNMSERLLFLTSKRKRLLSNARGHVLEVAVGTGRNIPYYQTKQCATVTLLDSSGPMLAVAKRKWNDTHMEYFSRVCFKEQSALSPIVPPYGAQEGYDTVIQTMGLCSTPEPVKLLHNIEACTNANGKILLLEHGKSHYNWLNELLDKTAPAHADEHGCWWNKDIGKIVQESGLEVVGMQRFNFGTTWWVELKPRKGLRESLARETRTEPQAEMRSSHNRQKAWWQFWV